MIENKAMAADVSALMLHIAALINDSLGTVKARCGAAEADRYQSACDTVLMHILMEIVNPINELHPELSTDGDGDKPRRSRRKPCDHLSREKSDRRLHLVRSTPYSPGGRQ